MGREKGNGTVIDRSGKNGSGTIRIIKQKSEVCRHCKFQKPQSKFARKLDKKDKKKAAIDFAIKYETNLRVHKIEIRKRNSLIYKAT